MRLNDFYSFDLEELILRTWKRLSNEYRSSVNYSGMFKDGELYLFFYTDENKEKVNYVLGKFSCDQRLNIDFYNSSELLGIINNSGSNKECISRFKLDLPLNLDDI